MFGAHVDRDRIGVAGFSLGGYTALTLAGARPDFGRFGTYCQDTGAPPATCAEGPPAVRPGLAFFRDSRVKAAYLMAPGPGYFFTRDGLLNVRIPVHIDDPAEDEVLVRPYAGERIRDLLPRVPEYVRVPGVGHYVYLAPCPEPLARQTPKLCTDPPGIDRRGFHVELASEMADFFQRTMGGP